MKQTHWNWRQRTLAVVFWPSFLCACLGFGLFFAKVDATRISDALVWPLQPSTITIYSVGFLFFWALSFIGCALTAWMVRTERRRGDFPEPREGNQF